METEFTPFTSLAGGMLIGMAALLLMATHGKIAGISGILSRWLNEENDTRLVKHDNNKNNKNNKNNITSTTDHTNTLFLIGLLLGLPVFVLLTGNRPEITNDTPFVVLMIAGLFVGYGTVSGSGCTSGHGVCGLSRLSTRSFVATATFLLSGVVMTFLTRHVFSG